MHISVWMVTCIIGIRVILFVNARNLWYMNKMHMCVTSFTFILKTRNLVQTKSNRALVAAVVYYRIVVSKLNYKTENGRFYYFHGNTYVQNTEREPCNVLCNTLKKKHWMLISRGNCKTVSFMEKQYKRCVLSFCKKQPYSIFECEGIYFVAWH